MQMPHGTCKVTRPAELWGLEVGAGDGAGRHDILGHCHPVRFRGRVARILGNESLCRPVLSL
jgi:hypothetical protein